MSLILLIVFVRLVFTDNKNKHAIQHTRHLIKINEDEVKALADDYYHFAEGSEFIPKDHLYANDLDIFGRASLFQYINRTTSEMGGNTLGQWLLNPADTETILERQIAIKELNTKTEWRQQLQAYGKSHNKTIASGINTTGLYRRSNLSNILFNRLSSSDDLFFCC